MMTSTAFVLLMTVLGWRCSMPVWYAEERVIDCEQSFSIFCVVAVLWVIYGYSAAFTAGHEGNMLAPFIGSLDKWSCPATTRPRR